MSDDSKSAIHLGGLRPIGVRTLQGLKDLQSPQGLISVLGLDHEADGLGGMYYWDAASVAAADDYDIVASNSGSTGRWLVFTRFSGLTTEFRPAIVPDGITDAQSGIQAAIDRAYNAGGGVVQLPAGNIFLASGLVPKDLVTIRGMGMGVTRLLQAGDFNVFNPGGSGTGISFQYKAFEDFTIVGQWQTLPSQSTNSRHFSLLRTQHIRIERVESIYCRFMAITAQYCGEVMVHNCRVRYAARDSINTTSCERNIITGNRLMHCWDDAIAIHQTESDGNPPREQQIIQGNIIEDCFGIKALGLRKASISGNIITRAKGYGIYCSASGVEGESDHLGISIQGNVITDTIQSAKFGAGAQQFGIYFANRSQSYQAPVVGGATPDVNKPENFWYLNNAPSAQNAGASGVNISDNIIAWTLKHTPLYSDWGMDNVEPALGRGFTTTGWADPDMSTGHMMSGTGIWLNGAILDIDITGNTIYGCNSPITVASTLTALSELTVRDNSLRRYAGHGVGLETSAVKYGRVRISNNIFDGDPYFEHSNRTAGPDGTWSTGAQTPTAVDCVNFETIEFFNNSLRNLNQVFHTNANTKTVGGGNVYYMEPAAGDTVSTPSNSNKGIRSPSYRSESGAKIVWETSDPTSTSYGQVLFAQGTMAAGAIPSTGYYISGQFVMCVGVAVATQTLEAGATDPTPQYTLIGWRRLTTGNAHVLNTDWREMRCLTGN